MTPTALPTARLAARMRGVASSPVRELLALTTRPEVISFAGGLPAPELFDVTGLRSAFDHVLTGPAARTTLQYAPTEGNLDLRTLVAARMTRRGLPTSARDLLVTTGSQQALTLLATVLLDPGAVVAVEEPTYLAALQSFRLMGAPIVAVPGDDAGIDPAALAETIERERPTLLYLVPTFANPTGRTLTAERRTLVAELAAAHDLWVIEDDPYSELRYRGDAVAPLAAEPAAGDRVIHLGSFSKTGAPGLRLGWLRAPAHLMPALVVAKQAADLHTSTIDQAAAARWLATTDLDLHVRTLCDVYRKRRNTMLAALPAALPPGSTWSDPDGGMFVWVRLPPQVDTTRLLPLALERDVAFVPGTPFFPGEPDRSTLRLSFTTQTPDRIEEGLRRLGALLHDPRSTWPT
jgi:2-aminoadipate transaminase